MVAAVIEREAQVYVRRLRARAKERSRRKCWLVVAFMVGVFMAGTTGRSAASSPGSGAAVIGVDVGSETRDLMSVSDVRPTSRGGVTGGLTIGRDLGKKWRVGISGRIGGAWLDFRQVLGASGNIKDQNWAGRLWLDRWVVREADYELYTGLGAEYGEARSWTDTRFFSDEGPRTFMGGGALHVGVLVGVLPATGLNLEACESVYHAHAHDASTRSDYNWLGRSFSMTVGVQVHLLRGKDKS